MGKRFDDLADWDKVHIYVTKSDIKKGAQKSAYSCPVARSLFRRGFKSVQVRYTTADIEVGGRAALLELPESAKIFIKKFDAGQRVKPFRATLKKRLY